MILRAKRHLGKLCLGALTWLAIWLLLVALIVLAGALLGALLFAGIGSLAGMDYPVTHMLRRGFLDGGFLALIWAPAGSIVACVMWSHRRAGKP